MSGHSRLAPVTGSSLFVYGSYSVSASLEGAQNEAASAPFGDADGALSGRSILLISLISWELCLCSHSRPLSCQSVGVEIRFEIAIQYHKKK